MLHLVASRPFVAYMLLTSVSVDRQAQNENPLKTDNNTNYQNLCWISGLHLWIDEQTQMKYLMRAMRLCVSTYWFDQIYSGESIHVFIRPIYISVKHLSIFTISFTVHTANAKIGTMMSLRWCEMNGALNWRRIKEAGVYNLLTTSNNNSVTISFDVLATFH